MVAAVHDEGRTVRDCTEAADDQAVVLEREEVADVALETQRVVEVVVIGVVADLDLRVADDGVQENERGLDAERLALPRVGGGSTHVAEPQSLWLKCG